MKFEKVKQQLEAIHTSLIENCSPGEGFEQERSLKMKLVAMLQSSKGLLSQVGTDAAKRVRVGGIPARFNAIPELFRAPLCESLELKLSSLTGRLESRPLNSDGMLELTAGELDRTFQSDGLTSIASFRDALTPEETGGLSLTLEELYVPKGHVGLLGFDIQEPLTLRSEELLMEHVQGYLAIAGLHMHLAIRGSGLKVRSRYAFQEPEHGHYTWTAFSLTPALLEHWLLAYTPLRLSDKQALPDAPNDLDLNCYGANVP